MLQESDIVVMKSLNFTGKFSQETIRLESYSGWGEGLVMLGMKRGSLFWRGSGLYDCWERPGTINSKFQLNRPNGTSILQ